MKKLNKTKSIACAAIAGAAGLVGHAKADHPGPAPPPSAVCHFQDAAPAAPAMSVSDVTDAIKKIPDFLGRFSGCHVVRVTIEAAVKAAMAEIFDLVRDKALTKAQFEALMASLDDLKRGAHAHQAVLLFRLDGIEAGQKKASDDAEALQVAVQLLKDAHDQAASRAATPLVIQVPVPLVVPVPQKSNSCGVVGLYFDKARKRCVRAADKPETTPVIAIAIR